MQLFTTKEVLNFDLATLLAKLEASKDGLSAFEAKQRLAHCGLNTLGQRRTNAWRILGRQLKSSLVYLLAIAAAISYWTNDTLDGAVILAILFINTALSFSQEFKSERTLERLGQFVTKTARVKRNGKDELVDQTLLAPGDVVTIQQGDVAPVDVALLETTDLQVNESQISGEAVPVSKFVASHNLTAENIVQAGSTVEKGEGVGLVYATGKATTLGKIAALSTQTKKETPYEKSLQSFSAFLIKVTFFGLALVFAFKLLTQPHSVNNLTQLLLFMIATAVAVVPEVLPVIATVSLSRGSLYLARKNVVVKRLGAVEDLGNVSILCTDKTGTITENRMEVRGITAHNRELFEELALAVHAPVSKHRHHPLNSYDDAFARYMPKETQERARAWHIVKELPFDPTVRRRRVILINSASARQILMVIGAPESVLEVSHAETRERDLPLIKQEEANGLHHIAIAYKYIHSTPDFDISAHECDLAFVGFASFIDPLRPSALHTIKAAERLGLQIKILTGDSREVAEYVGREVGLVQPGEKIYLGDELEAMPAAQFRHLVVKSHVFARVSPAQKFAIIKALKESAVVAYQGDGINDAPALKMADVAIAVSDATDIAKENADIVLLHSSLEVIVAGIRYGRSIFVNINKYIKYTMVNNVGNFIALATLYTFSTDLPMLPIQVLLTSMITDVPLVAISSDTVEEAEVARPEQHNVRSLMAMPLVLGVPTALFELLYFLFIRTKPLAEAQTSLYALFTALTFIIFFVVRTSGHFWQGKRPSTTLNWSFFLAAIVSFGIIYEPVTQAWFSFVPLASTSLVIVALFTVVYLFVCDGLKVWYYAK